MTDFEGFDRNARRNGVLIDTNMLVLLIVGSVNRERVSQFKRTSDYSSTDWDLLIGVLEQISQRYTIPHVLAEVSALTDLKGPEREIARVILRNLIGTLDELEIRSVDACANTVYVRLGLTDAAIAAAARLRGCSVLTNDSVCMRRWRLRLLTSLCSTTFDSSCSHNTSRPLLEPSGQAPKPPVLHSGHAGSTRGSG
jgi:predicted nucleic acid-binding protein